MHPRILHCDHDPGVAAHAARGDEPLRWKFSKGQTIHYTMTQKTLSKTEAGGQKGEFTQNQDTDMTWKITKVDASGNAEMDQTIDRIVLTTTGPAGEMKVDTKTEPGPEENGPIGMAAKVLRGMVGSPFHMKMSVQGDISDVTVPPKVLEALKGLGPAFGAMFSEEGIKRMTGQATIVLPEKAVAKGYTWKSNKSLPMPFGTMLLDSTYTYEGPEGPIARIGVAVKSDIKPSENGTMSVKLVSSDGKGEYRFDPKAGMLRNSEMNMKMTMQIKVGGQEMVTEVDSTTKLHEGGSAAK